MKPAQFDVYSPTGLGAAELRDLSRVRSFTVSRMSRRLLFVMVYGPFGSASILSCSIAQRGQTAGPLLVELMRSTMMEWFRHDFLSKSWLSLAAHLEFLKFALLLAACMLEVPASQPENLTAISISPSHDISYTSFNVSWEAWRAILQSTLYGHFTSLYYCNLCNFKSF